MWVQAVNGGGLSTINWFPTGAPRRPPIASLHRFPSGQPRKPLASKHRFHFITLGRSTACQTLGLGPSRMKAKNHNQAEWKQVWPVCSASHLRSPLQTAVLTFSLTLHLPQDLCSCSPAGAGASVFPLHHPDIPHPTRSCHRSILPVALPDCPASRLLPDYQ